MARSSRGMSAKDYKSVGTTYDGVRILAPKKKATSFTTAEIRAAIAGVIAARIPPAEDKPKPRKRTASERKPAATK